MSRRRSHKYWAVASAALAVVGLTFSSGALGSATAATTAAPAFTASKTITRTNLVNGQTQIADKRDFKVSVSQTSNLQDHQVINVSWTGAHPTGGLIANQQGATADEQEYPVVIMECRGVDSASKPLNPDTCWTNSPNERVPSGSGTPLWSLDQYAPAAQRQALVGIPTNPTTGKITFSDANPVPPGDVSTSCETLGYWLHFVAADGTDYPIGPNGCNGEPSGMSQVQAKDVLPGDTTYAVTNPSQTSNPNDTSGSAKFSINTADANPALGCSTTVACSLVIIPIEGISCDPAGVPSGITPSAADIANCESTGNFQAGVVNNGSTPAESVTGELWFLPSNWRNRVSVPLKFAVSADVCSARSSAAPLSVFGSELQAEATDQWNPHVCQGKGGFDVTHVQTAEPEAKNLLAAGSIESAFQAMPASEDAATFFPDPTVQAPVGLTGFAIAFVIDGANGQPVTSLNLDARLLAKLMTESYAGTGTTLGDWAAQAAEDQAKGDGAGAKAYQAVEDNPLAIFDDPEFQALNPGLGINDITPHGEDAEGAAELFSIIGQSDVISALTSYINADPEARAWLDGQPDPWGMSVNPAYKDIALPTSSWPLLDDVTVGPAYESFNGAFVNQCLADEPVNARQPFRPTLDGPQANLAQVALNLQFGIATSAIGCTEPTGGVQQWTTIGQEPVGARFVIGVVPLALADQYDLDTAALETFRSPSAPAKFTDGSDRVFVAPDDTSLKAAAQLFQPNAQAGTWTFPYSDFPTDSAAAGAYPGTMLVSMDVPTSGLASSDAAHYGTYLDFVSGPGQTPGTASGQLPAGYLPITASNGLGHQVAYDTAAVRDIRAQNCLVPSLSGGTQVGPDCSPTASRSSGPGRSKSSGGSGGPGGFAGANGSGISSGSNAGSSSTSATNAANTASKIGASNPGGTGGAGTPGSKSGGGGAPTQVVALAGGGRTPGFGAGIGAIALPLALGLLILGLGYTGSTRFLGTSFGRRVKNRLKLKKGMSFVKLLRLARSRP